MPDHFQTDPFDTAPLPTPPNLARLYTPLPGFLERRLIRPGEEVTFVRGPRWSPAFEPLLTHPLVFGAALLVGALLVGAARLAAHDANSMHPAPVAVAIGIVLGSIMVLAFFNGYFTRLIVTSERLMIVQGIEVRRSWGIEALPPSLLRHDPRRGTAGKSIDLDAVQTLLGNPSTGFTDAKSIRSFGKQIAQIRKQHGE